MAEAKNTRDVATERQHTLFSIAGFKLPSSTVLGSVFSLKTNNTNLWRIGNLKLTRYQCLRVSPPPSQLFVKAAVEEIKFQNHLTIPALF